MTSLFFPFESPGRQTIDWDLLGYVVLCVCLRACVWVCVCLYLPPLDPEMYPGSITASVVSRRLIALRTAPIRDRRCVTEPLSCLWPTRKIPGKIRRNQSQFKSDWSVLLERTVSDFISGIFLSFFPQPNQRRFDGYRVWTIGSRSEFIRWRRHCLCIARPKSGFICCQPFLSVGPFGRQSVLSSLTGFSCKFSSILLLMSC